MTFPIVLKLFAMFALFVCSSGILFFDFGRKYMVLVALTAVVAILSTFYLSLEFYKDLVNQLRDDIGTGNKPTIVRQPATTGSTSFPHGHKFDDCSGADWCPKMIVVRGGRFAMGSSLREEGRSKNEGPRRDVTIRKFSVGRYEVSVGEYLSCVDFGKCRAPQWQEKGSKFNIKTGSSRAYKMLQPSLTAVNSPIVGISWDDAQSYVKWLSERTGQRYRLLTEAEWEYSALAGAATRYWMGNSILSSQANYHGIEKLLPINSFKPNPFGLYNVHGNVWEWVEDCWHSDYKGAPTDGSAWLKANGGNCDFRVLRGGSWIDIPQDLRARNRVGDIRGFRNFDVGFRVARAL